MEERKEELRKGFEMFTKGKEFMLNPDKKFVDMLLDGIIRNREKYGLGYCPCRVLSGDKKKDLELVCPCNFFVHSTWVDPKDGRSRCWCGLFIKR